MRLSKIICLLLSIVLLFSSCNISTNSPAEKIKTYLDKNDYNKCNQYLQELNTQDFNNNYNLISDEIINKFDSLVNEHNVNLYNVSDLSLYSIEFLDNCRNLWNVASLLNITNKSENFEKYIFLKYFSVISDYFQYCEIYKLIKDINNVKALSTLDSAIVLYNQNGNSNTFETAYNIFNSFELDVYNPSRLYVNEYKEEHNKIKNSLLNLINGFSENNTQIIGSSISEIKASLEKVLYICDVISFIHLKTNNLFNKIRTSKSLNYEYKIDIDVPKREYIPGNGLDLSNIFFQRNNDEAQESTEETTAIEENIKLDDAIKLSQSAVNNLKNENNNLSIKQYKKSQNKLASLNGKSYLNSSTEYVKQNINNILKEKNTESTIDMEFIKGFSNDTSLNTFIPPSNNEFSINPLCVDSYNVVNGSGGTIIKFIIKQDVVTNNSHNSNINRILDNDIIDINKEIKSYEIYYAPTTIYLTLNGNNELIKLEYLISGVNEIKFIDNSTNESYVASIAFENNLIYNISY